MQTESPLPASLGPSQRLLLFDNSRLTEHMALIRTSAMFAGLTEDACREVASCAHCRTFARGELLFSQGEPGNRLLLLQSGMVKHTQRRTGGDEVLLWISGRGDAICAQPELLDRAHTCSARALERCRALAWEFDRLRALVDRHPQIGMNLNQLLILRLHELEERFREIATETVVRRLILMLLRLAKKVGMETDEGIRIALGRRDLAQMTGTTVFTVSRIVSRWSEKGLVSAQRECVSIGDPRLLEQLGDEPED